MNLLVVTHSKPAALPTARSIDRRSRDSCGATKVKASPDAEARAVRIRGGEQTGLYLYDASLLRGVQVQPA